ncbi:MAG: hypothetical protein J0H84_16980 [Rhizobiales bacterium]|jgi:hypothetical protein|nr:hypothetical protein [Hyphomicrobiales bacterium]
MSRRDVSLEHQILATFKLAYETDQLAVAEHLLCALECLCGEVNRETAADDAYRTICSCRPMRVARRDPAH